MEVVAPVTVVTQETFVENLIIKYSKEYGIDPILPLNIAYAESRFKNVPNFKYDGEDGKYTAYGIFQFTRTTYKQHCDNPNERVEIEPNIKCGVRMIAEGKTGHWQESHFAWSKTPYPYPNLGQNCEILRGNPC